MAAPLYHLDPSPLLAEHGRRPVADTVRCEVDGVLGAALVVSARKSGMTIWGHGSLRIVACADGSVRDLEYETYRLDAWNRDLLKLEHAGAPWLDRLDDLDRAMVLFRNVDPVDAGWFGQTETRENRDVLELWLDLPPERLARLADDAAAWYDDQRAVFASGGAIDGRYVPWKRNCTEVWRRLLPELDPGSALPFVWLRAHEDGARMRVLHPSLGSLARVTAWPGSRPRFRPVFRRHPEPTLEDLPTGALGPWAPPTS
jgi:hypothetical protein